MIRFANPWWLLLLALPMAYLGAYYLKKFLKPVPLGYSNIRLIGKPKITYKVILHKSLPPIFALALAIAVIAAARPQSGHGEREVYTEGIDIMLALDISGSMRSADFRPDNRLTVSKQVIQNFIESRQGDRIGLVAFAKQAFTQCPLTTDYKLLKEYLDDVDFNMVDDGTAIGLALAIAANHLQESDAKSKIVILLTDGVNNAGEIDPITAAKALSSLRIKTYTIGAGKQGMVDYPVQDPIFGMRYVKRKSEIDEETLKEIAELTGGRFYRAKDSQTLQDIYDEISGLEKTKIEVKEYYRYEELYHEVLVWGVILIFAGVLIGAVVVRSVP